MRILFIFVELGCTLVEKSMTTSTLLCKGSQGCCCSLSFLSLPKGFVLDMALAAPL